MASLLRVIWLVFLLVLSVLSGLFMASPVQAYGAAGGAPHDATCYASNNASYPSYGKCGASVGAIRDADAGKLMANLKETAPSYNYAFQAWNVCPETFTGQVGNCSFYYTKTLISSGAVTMGNNGSMGYTRSQTQTVDCTGAGYLQTAQGCFCAPGYASAPGGTCTPQVCPDPGPIPGTDGKGWGYDNMDHGGTSVCFDGCLITGSTGVGYDHKWFILGPFYNTGQKCNPSNQGGTYPPAGNPNLSGAPPMTDAPDCQAGQCPGTVNGTQVCVACDDTSTGGYHGNGQGGQWTQTNCSNGTCWTSHGDIDKDGNAGPPKDWDVGSGGGNPQANPGGSGNCTGTSCQQDQKSFCEENPDSPICKDSTWAGTCESSFTCDGDAIQCAIAKEQHSRNCTLFVTHTDMTDKGLDAAQGLDQPDGHPFKDAPSTSIDFNSKIDMSNPLSGSCPAGRSVTVAGHSLVVVTSGLCDSLAMVGNVIVAFGALCSVFIVFKG